MGQILGSAVGDISGLLSGGSNSAGNSNSSVAGLIQNATGTPANSTNPAWENTAAQNVANSAITAANQPYTPYTGKLVAGTNANQGNAANLAAAAPGRYADTYSQTQGDLNQAGQQYNQTYNAQNVTPQTNNQQISTLPSWTTPGTAQQYMNPYTSATLAPQLTDLNNSFAEQQNQLNGNAASAGAFGGSRQALLNTQLSNQQDEATQNLTNQAYSTAYNTGQTAYQNAQNTNLQAQAQQTGINQANVNNNLAGQEYNSTLGLNAYNTNYNDVTQGNRAAALNAATGENNLVNTQQGASNSIINNLETTGAVGQNTAQNQDTANYGQFENQVYYPEQQASYLNTLLKGSPATGSISYAANQSGSNNNGVFGLGNSLSSLLGGSSGLGSLFGGSSAAAGDAATTGITDGSGFLGASGAGGVAGSITGDAGLSSILSDAGTVAVAGAPFGF